MLFWPATICLLLSDFALGEASYSDQSANIKDTILWFHEKYLTDQSFQQRVDEAALRVIQLKLVSMATTSQLKTSWQIQMIWCESVGQGDSVVFDMAQTSTTLISPDY